MKSKAMAKRTARRVLFVIWVIVTIVAMSMPLGKPSPLIQRGLDKTIHTGMFVVMGVLGQAALPWSGILITAPIAFGVEYLQRLLPTRREYNQVDLLSNLIGLGLGIVGYELATRLK